MTMPSIFADSTSSLYDENRNLNHLYPAVIDFGYSYGDALPSTDEEVAAAQYNNMLKIRTAFNEGLPLPELFLGDPVTAGETVTSSSTGSLESIHNSVHMWTGPDDEPYMDMGNFYSAGRDPIFFCHHSNVDRMWHIYRSMRGYQPDFTDTDWLDTSFLFVDENKQLVKVNVTLSLSLLKTKTKTN